MTHEQAMLKVMTAQQLKLERAADERKMKEQEAAQLRRYVEKTSFLLLLSPPSLVPPVVSFVLLFVVFTIAIAQQ